MSLTSIFSASTWSNIKSKDSFEILRTRRIQIWPYFLYMVKIWGRNCQKTKKKEILRSTLYGRLIKTIYLTWPSAALRIWVAFRFLSSEVSITVSPFAKIIPGNTFKLNLEMRRNFWNIVYLAVICRTLFYFFFYLFLWFNQDFWG